MRSGRLPALAARTAKSSARASSATISRRPGQRAAMSASAARQRGSRSTAMTLAAPSASSARVSPPGPGPISMIATPASGPAARAMRPVRLRSNRKFWPSDFLRASSPWPRRPRAAAAGRRAARRPPRRAGAASAQRGDQAAGLATPLPAMSKAVPWSGEVRMNGRPSVTLTPASKASVLIGIRPWS